jgi:hypothetical protein
MNFTVIFALIICALNLNGQNVIALEKLKNGDSLQPGKAVIYGKFVQRLGFSSGGFTQDIYVRNTNTGQLYSIIVKPAFKSAKENEFFFSYSIRNL